MTPGLPAIEIKQQTIEFARKAAELLGVDLDIHLNDICVMDDYIGDGYLKSTPESRSAMILAAEFENLQLDPTYTAKAFAGMIDQIKKRLFLEDQTVVFLHTAG